MHDKFIVTLESQYAQQHSLLMISLHRADDTKTDSRLITNRVTYIVEMAATACSKHGSAEQCLYNLDLVHCTAGWGAWMEQSMQLNRMLCSISQTLFSSLC